MFPERQLSSFHMGLVFSASLMMDEPSAFLSNYWSERTSVCVDSLYIAVHAAQGEQLMSRV
jgi:hypothetical protein